MKYLEPDRERFHLFTELPREGKIHMLNLVKLKPAAIYADGTMITGAEAYHAYSRDAQPVFERLGGRIVWSGKFEFMVIGPPQEHWDICYIAEYRNAQAFMEMLRDEDYRQALNHRRAAVATSRLIRLSPNEHAGGFG